jgi:hypothetical protein
MNPMDLILQDAFDILKIVAIPLLGFFLYQFYTGVVSLKESVDRLILKMQHRETYCIEKHKEIDDQFCRHDSGIEEMKTTLGDHSERISKIEGKLSK